MTLAAKKPGLLSDFESLFSNPPDTESECAELWGDAVSAYFLGLSPPPVTITGARAAFVAALSGMSEPGAAFAIFPVAFSVLGASIASGLPIVVTPASPPSSSIDFSSLSNQSDPKAAANVVANAIHAWALTGKYGGGVPWI